MMNYKRTVVLLVLTIALSSPHWMTNAQELRRLTEVSNYQRDLGFWDWLLGRENATNTSTAKNSTGKENGNGNNNQNNGSGGGWLGNFLGQVWCGIFRNCEDAKDPNRPTPIEDLVTDVLNTTDGSHPVQEALNKTQGSETPLRDFLAELLNQPGSERPVQDFIREAFNRSDTPLLDFLADLFDTISGKPARDFVKDLVNGTTSPLADAMRQWMSQEVFQPLNCTAPAGAPPCAYNLDGAEGVWVCRTLFNPFQQGNATSTTVCAVPQYTLQNNDKCGSCDGKYPTACPCRCDVNKAGDMQGVWVTLKGGDNVQQCVNSKWATASLMKYENMACVTTCA